MFKFIIYICTFIGVSQAFVDVTVDQALVNPGFHRLLVTNITLYGNLSSCRLAVEEKFPKNLVVCKGELDDLSGEQKIVTRLSTEINTEASATEATPFSLYIYLNKSQPVTTSLEFSSVYIYSIPVHVRYHDPKSGGGFREFKKQPAVLFARCPDGSSVASSAVVKLPCEPQSAELCDWRSLAFTQKSLIPQLLIPVGNIDHYQIVLLSAHVVAYVGVSCILYALFSTKISS